MLQLSVTQYQMTLLLNPLPFIKETESLISKLLLSSENYFNETFFKIVILSFPLMKKRRSVTFISYCYSPTLTYLGSLRISCM